MYNFTFNSLLFSYIYLSKNLGHLIHKVTNQEKKKEMIFIGLLLNSSFIYTTYLLLNSFRILKIISL